jgi:hypothetical protein
MLYYKVFCSIFKHMRPISNGATSTDQSVIAQLDVVVQYIVT